MKEIKQCPLTKEKCPYRANRFKTKSGCSLYDDVNLCDKCLKHRKKQSKYNKWKAKIMRNDLVWI